MDWNGRGEERPDPGGSGRLYRTGCRGGRIRTDDLLLPKQTRYLATLLPEAAKYKKIPCEKVDPVTDCETVLFASDDTTLRGVMSPVIHPSACGQVGKDLRAHARLRRLLSPSITGTGMGSTPLRSAIQ